MQSLTGSRVRLACVAGVLALSSACALRAGPPHEQERSSVVVQNQSTTDMTIFALEGGSVRRRLGVAGGARTTEFTIPATLVGLGRDVQFVADPIAQRGMSVTRRIFVRPGDEVRLVIPP